MRLGLGVVDEVVEEPVGGAHRDPDDAARRLNEALRRHLDELHVVGSGLSGTEALVTQRYQKFRAMGVIESEK